MYYVIRNATGAIQSLSREDLPGSERREASDPEVLQFLGQAPNPSAFNTSDAEFVRVLEDLIDTLITKNVIRQTDLPAAAQAKLMQRKGLRTRIHGALNLFGSDERIL